jgi:fructose-bisphosphate aldolase class I
MDGAHSLERCAVVTEKVQAAVFKACSDHHVLLEGCLFKPNMVRSGSSCPTQANAQQVARATVRVLQHTVPVALAGIFFLSGGMSEEQATECLNEINKFPGRKPWHLSFSYGRALQQSVLKAWQGKSENVQAAQQQLLLRAKANSLAVRGQYAGQGKAGAAASQSLEVKNYVY